MQYNDIEEVIRCLWQLQIYAALHNSSVSRARCEVYRVVELLAAVDVDPEPGLANWTTSRKYVINRPRICHAKQSRRNPRCIVKK